MMNLNKIFKYALFGAASLMVMPALVSCDDDDNNSGADPVIRYVRTTSASASDSLITAGSLGQVIAIIGDNLQNVHSITFNDRPAILNTAYMTNDAIIITIPKDIPDEITDKMYVETMSGEIIEYPFVSSIPEPFVSSISCEQVKEGDVVYVNGNFFVATEDQPVELTFGGNVKGEYLPEKSSYTSAAFKVPAGVQPGKISVRTAYGVANPSAGTAYINDDRKELVFLDFDKWALNGWGKTAVVDGDFGKCAHLTGDEVDLWSWNEPGSILCSLTGEGQPRFNSGIEKAEQGILKFEMKVVKPWTAVALYLEFQTPDQSTNNAFGTNPGYCYEPWKTGPVLTDGWVTVSIPLDKFNQNTDGTGNAAGTFDPTQINGINAFVRGGTGAEGVTTVLDMYLDNFRIVPAK